MDKIKSSDSDGEYGAKLSNYLQHLTGQVFNCSLLILEFDTFVYDKAFLNTYFT